MIKSKTRPNIIQTTLDDANFALLKRRAEGEGLSVTAWVRQRVLSVLNCVPPEQIRPEETGEMEPRIGTPEREEWQRGKNLRATKIMEGLKIEG